MAAEVAAGSCSGVGWQLPPALCILWRRQRAGQAGRQQRIPGGGGGRLREGLSGWVRRRLDQSAGRVRAAGPTCLPWVAPRVNANDRLSERSLGSLQIVSGARDKTIKLWNTLGECK